MENVNKLIEVLDRQGEIYQDLLDVTKNKKDVIVAGKVLELENITKLEQTLIFKMGDLEEEVEKTSDLVVKELAINDKQINISTIAKHLKGEQRTKLEEQRDHILSIVNEINHLNQLNAQLISSSLDFINFSFNLLNNANSDANAGYQQSGDIKVNKASFFDKKL